MKFIIGKDRPEPTINIWLEDRKNGATVMMRATDGSAQNVLEIGITDEGLSLNVRRIHDARLLDALKIMRGDVATGAMPVSYEPAPPMPPMPASAGASDATA